MKSIVVKHSEEDHWWLESDAKSTKTILEKSIDYHIALNQGFRRSLINREYYNLGSERTFSRFTINGLKGHYEFREEAREFRLTRFTDSLHTLEEH